MPFLDVGPQLPVRPGDDFVPGSGNTARQNKTLHRYSRPWQGNNATSNDNAYRVGRMVGESTPGGPINRFLFHYNPQSVTISTNASDTNLPSSQMLQPETFAQPNATETMSFDLLLNRIVDVSFTTAETGGAGTYGTLYDLYYLFGVINRNFTDDLSQFDYPGTDVGILEPNTVVVIFGELFRFVGVVTGLGIQHAKFISSPLSTPTSAPLVPVLTTVSLQLMRAPGGVDSGTGGDPNANGDPSGGMAAQPGVKPTTGKPDLANGNQPLGEPPNQSYYSSNYAQTLPGPDSSNQQTTVIPTGPFDPTKNNVGGG